MNILDGAKKVVEILSKGFLFGSAAKYALQGCNHLKGEECHIGT